MWSFCHPTFPLYRSTYLLAGDNLWRGGNGVSEGNIRVSKWWQKLLSEKETAPSIVTKGPTWQLGILQCLLKVEALLNRGPQRHLGQLNITEGCMDGRVAKERSLPLGRRGILQAGCVHTASAWLLRLRILHGVSHASLVPWYAPQA